SIRIGPPTVAGARVSVTGVVVYTLSGAPPLGLPFSETATYRGAEIVHLEDASSDAALADVAEWMARYGDLLPRRSLDGLPAPMRRSARPGTVERPGVSPQEPARGDGPQEQPEARGHAQHHGEFGEARVRLDDAGGDGDKPAEDARTPEPEGKFPA